MNGFVESIKSVFLTISNAVAPFVSIPLLMVVGLLVLIAKLAEPGKGLKKFNVPILTWSAIVVAVYVGLQSLTFLTAAGFKTTDKLIITQIAIIVALFVLMGYYGGAVSKVVFVVLILVVLGAIVVTGLAGPSDSIMSTFVRVIQSAVNSIIGSIKPS